MTPFAPNWTLWIEPLAIAGGIVFFFRALYLLVKYGIHLDDHIGIMYSVRMLRHLLLAIGLFVIAGAHVTNQEGLLMFGFVFLLEELYETSMVLGVLKWDAERTSALDNAGCPG